MTGIDPNRSFRLADANVRYPIAKRSFDCPALLAIIPDADIVPTGVRGVLDRSEHRR
jgi:hypothetical protein